MKMNSVSNFLSNKNLTYKTKGIMGAVVFTTLLKASGRPAFIMADKKSDKESKKYAATKEFLYQMLCLGLTFLMVLPAQRLTFKITKNFMKGSEELEKIKTYKDFEIVNKDINEFTQKAKDLLKPKTTGLEGNAREKFNLVKGADELVSFVSSLIGLTIVAPLLSHEILHPIMKSLNMEKKDSIGKPAEIFLADAKIPDKKTGKINVNV